MAEAQGSTENIDNNAPDKSLEEVSSVFKINLSKHIEFYPFSLIVDEQ